MAVHIFTSDSGSFDLITARAESSSSHPAYVLWRIHAPRYVPYALPRPVPRSIVYYRTPRTGIPNWYISCGSYLRVLPQSLSAVILMVLARCRTSTCTAPVLGRVLVRLRTSAGIGLASAWYLSTSTGLHS